jgi:hypothetical protein
MVPSIPVILQCLAPGATLADVQRWRAGDRTGPRPLMPVDGGTTRQSPGSTLYWTVDLEAGGYLFLCLVADVRDKRQHTEHGMRQGVRCSPPGREYWKGVHPTSP